MNINECAGINCGNGTCQDMVAGYTCLCHIGYTGSSCEIKIDYCLEVNCGNGVCQDLVNGYECACQIGYTGSNCLTNINDCIGVDTVGKEHAKFTSRQ